MMFGVVLVGTYTSVFIASPILIYLGVGRARQGEREDAEAEAPPTAPGSPSTVPAAPASPPTPSKPSPPRARSRR
jgi:hypothetical protein